MKTGYSMLGWTSPWTNFRKLQVNMKRKSSLTGFGDYAMTLIAVLRIMSRRMRRKLKKRIDLRKKSRYDQDNNEKSK